MIRRIYGLLFFIICAAPVAFASPLAAGRCCIVEAARAAAFTGGFLRADGYWTPSEKEADDALDRLYGRFRVSSFKDQAEIYAHFAEYRVQIVGYLKDGQRLLLLNFLRDKSRPDPFPGWRESLVIVEDGGWSYWSCHYDVTEKKVVRIDINGEA